MAGENRCGYIYAFSCEAGAVKIGKTGDVDKRKREIEYKFGFPVTVLGKWEVPEHQALATERFIHWELRDKHVGMEWFDTTAAEAGAAISYAISTSYIHRIAAKRIPARGDLTSIKHLLNISLDTTKPRPRGGYGGRKKLYPERLTLPLEGGTTARIDSVVRDNETRLDVIREAVEAELARREAQSLRK